MGRRIGRVISPRRSISKGWPHAVEPVATCSWNPWPHVHGFDGHIPVEYAARIPNGGSSSPDCARPRLLPQHSIIRQPSHDHCSLRQRRHFVCHASLLGLAVRHHRRTDPGRGVRTHPCAAAQEERGDPEGGLRPRPASGGEWHPCAPGFPAVLRRDPRARPPGEG